MVHRRTHSRRSMASLQQHRILPKCRRPVAFCRSRTRSKPAIGSHDHRPRRTEEPDRQSLGRPESKPHLRENHRQTQPGGREGDHGNRRGRYPGGRNQPGLSDLQIQRRVRLRKFRLRLAALPRQHRSTPCRPPLASRRLRVLAARKKHQLGTRRGGRKPHQGTHDLVASGGGHIQLRPECPPQDRLCRPRIPQRCSPHRPCLVPQSRRSRRIRRHRGPPDRRPRLGHCGPRFQKLRCRHDGTRHPHEAAQPGLP